MQKEKRCRDVPAHESGDMILREDFLVGEKLLREIEIGRSVIVVDRPCKDYLNDIAAEISAVYPSQEVAVVCGRSEPEKFKGTVVCPYSVYTSRPWISEGKVCFVFVNIRKTQDKRAIMLQKAEAGEAFYFVSNVYKIESMKELEKAGIPRVLPVKTGFGLARSPVAFARRHEIIFSGASHLKRSAFIIALERDITVPCIVVADSASEMEEVEECIERVPALRGKCSQSMCEYAEKKKWVWITTHADLKKKIEQGGLKRLKEITSSVIAYAATDRTPYLLDMHKVSQSVFSVTTTKDRGKSKKIVEVLPRYGIILEETAEHMKNAYNAEKEKRAAENIEEKAQ
ncbi:uncharacterized protein NEMAJ01_0889 [Nematocida major]|uniref:uncharacterized protein n=1 Tax=Nematocida major TaxID=1912982 RepID=UPI0020084117|nr:uncharacterized protein NEMAJ01_0889 [Nematocida major]KAH9385993.1 hypothetical protein NEMAJ01_0889 [Nematocida major]